MVMQDAVDEARGMPLLVDAMYSAATFGMIAFKLQSTVEMARFYKEQIKLEKNSKEKARMESSLEEYEELADATPFLVNAVNPKALHLVRTAKGLERLVEHREIETTELWSEFGREAAPHMKVGDTVNYFEYWDRYQFCCWTSESKEPLRHEENNLGFVPYVVQYVYGSTTAFGKTKVYPLLYSAWQGKTWDRMCLALTMITSNIMAMGQPSIAVEGDGMDAADLPFDLVGARINLPAGGKVHFLNEKLNTDQMHSMYQLLAGLFEQSTMNRMIFGKAPEHVLAFSTVNLLIQGARHQIQAPILLGGKALGELYRLMLRWLKHIGEEIKLYGEAEELILKPDMIPDGRIVVNVQLRPDMPQDRLQTGQLAKTLVDAGMLSYESALELMGYMDPQEELDKSLRQNVRRAIQDFIIQEQLREVAPAIQEAGTEEEPQSPWELPEEQAQQPQPGAPPPGAQPPQMSPEELQGLIPPRQPEAPLVQQQGTPGLRQELSAALGNEDLRRAGLGEVEG
jgi:hypothetical protein